MVGPISSPIRHLRAATGFSLLEILVVMAVAGVVTAMAIPVSTEFIRWAKSDRSIEVTIGVVNAARDRAVAERRNIELTFITPNRLRLEREEVDSSGATTGNTQVSETILEGGQQFVRFVGMTDTPDGFAAVGTANPPPATVFNGTAPFMFTSDGSLVDSGGDIVNGSIFTGIPNQPLSARAVTIFGPSGLTRSWKWRGNSWQR